MTKLVDLSRYIRSKNAGPFWMTIDIFASTDENYQRTKASKSLGKEEIGLIYQVDPEVIQIFHIDSLRVIKISIPRSKAQGHKYERDMHSGQQYVRMLDIEID